MKNKEKINFNNLLENIIYDVFSKLLEGKQNIEAHKENGGGWNPTLTKTLDMSVVVIDKDKLKKGTKLYRDPEFGSTTGAYYTFTHIPKEAISQIKKI